MNEKVLGVLSDIHGKNSTLLEDLSNGQVSTELFTEMFRANLKAMSEALPTEAAHG
jgi:hypothetical protein